MQCTAWACYCLSLCTCAELKYKCHSRSKLESMVSFLIQCHPANCLMCGPVHVIIHQAYTYNSHVSTAKHNTAYYHFQKSRQISISYTFGRRHTHGDVHRAWHKQQHFRPNTQITLPQLYSIIIDVPVNAAYVRLRIFAQNQPKHSARNTPHFVYLTHRKLCKICPKMGLIK